MDYFAVLSNEHVFHKREARTRKIFFKLKHYLYVIFTEFIFFSQMKSIQKIQLEREFELCSTAWFYPSKHRCNELEQLVKNPTAFRQNNLLQVINVIEKFCKHLS
jgi:hypothetical protein